MNRCPDCGMPFPCVCRDVALDAIRAAEDYEDLVLRPARAAAAGQRERQRRARVALDDVPHYAPHLIQWEQESLT